MQNFQSGNRSRDRRGPSRGGFGGGGRDSRSFTLHDAVCDQCGKNCQVPFRPSGEKPVYCSDCFDKKGGRGGRGGSGGQRDRGDSYRRNFDNRDSRRPSQSNASDRGASQLTEKIETLNTKLDTIIKLLSSAGEKKPELKKTELIKDKVKKNKKIKADSLSKTKSK